MLNSTTPTILITSDILQMTYQLSKELALLYELSQGLGGHTDSDKLRDELRLSRTRACALAQQNLPCVLPLIKK